MKDNAIPKMMVVSLIAGVILIALMLVNAVVGDRERYRREAVKSIEESTAGRQSVIGPVLVRPYKQTSMITEDDGKGGKKKVEHVLSLAVTAFPRTLDVKGKMSPEERRHGLYKVTVYTSAMQLKGAFDVPASKPDSSVEWEEPFLALFVADVRGLVSLPEAAINGKATPILQGCDCNLPWSPNLRIPLQGMRDLGGRVEFAVDLNLAGTEQLSLVPAGDLNHVEMASSWPSPLFAGRFLPRARELNKNGFRATWDIPSLATSTQIQMHTAESVIDRIDIRLLTPIDPYKLSDRATKYGILFVTLSFAGFFLFEMLTEVRIHPLQYLFVGFGLAIFFLLLVSFSEHMAFGLAYVISSLACIGLLSFYLCYVLRSISRGLAFGAMLSTFYAAVYGLLINEDNALVLGTLLLFVVLAAVMIVTRKVDWYRREVTSSHLGSAVPGAD